MIARNDSFLPEKEDEVCLGCLTEDALDHFEKYWEWLEKKDKVGGPKKQREYLRELTMNCFFQGPGSGPNGKAVILRGVSSMGKKSNVEPVGREESRKILDYWWESVWLVFVSLMWDERNG